MDRTQISALKSLIKELSDRHRKNKQAFKQAQKTCSAYVRLPIPGGTSEAVSWKNGYDELKDLLTYLHILYNKKRDKSPHLGSYERDNMFSWGKSSYTFKYWDNIINRWTKTEKQKEQEMREYSLIVVVNKGLSKSQKMVQAAHVVAEYTYYNSGTSIFKQWIERDKTILIYEADDQTLAQILNDAVSLSVTTRSFSDSDLPQFRVTAIAINPIDRPLWLDLQLA